VTRLGNLTSRRLVALVDPATHQFRIDWERSALVNGLVPATFTIAEDNRTYDLSGQTGALMEILQILKANGIGMNNMIDLRSNPAARQQVQSVVRRAAQQTQAAPSSPQPAGAPSPQYPSMPSAPSVSQRLQELETLRATGAVSDDEYNAKRAQILSDL
jgi:putative oligomerization/nucleic acid binding protein